MYGLNSLSKVFDSSDRVSFDEKSRIVLISDCHRGDGSWADKFSNNRSIYCAALDHYYKNNYMYIEIGDGDELWENKGLSTIIIMHKEVFQILSRFHKDGRFIMIFGNHDIRKKKFQEKGKDIFRYYDTGEKECTDILEKMQVHEGIVLQDEENGNNILLVHGHQADFLNSSLWKLARFLVRYLWKPLELLGFNDPTSASKNNKKKATVENKLSEWAQKNGHMLIAGHTHRPVFPDLGQPMYFNDGSCIHPNSITAIEIADGKITLVKWLIKAGKSGVLFVGKEIIAGPAVINDYFKEFLKSRESHKGDSGAKAAPANGCSDAEAKK